MSGFCLFFIELFLTDIRHDYYFLGCFKGMDAFFIVVAL